MGSPLACAPSDRIHMKSVLTFAALLAWLPVMATAPRPFHLTVAPGKVGEVCMALDAGDTLAWQFKANASAEFNLHHHVGDQVLMPVQRKAAAQDAGEHAIDQRNDWCLMWTAPPGQRLTVKGRWWLRRPGAK
jgi:hypothetical protein